MSQATTNGRDGAVVKLSYKYQRLRERLREAIATGELAGRLPGERALAHHYGANAKTLNKALNDLATEGILIRHVGRGTCVAKDVASDPVLGRARAYRWLVGHGQNHAFRDQAYDCAAAIATEHGHHLARLDVALDEQGELPDRALRPGQLRGLDGVVLYAVRASEGFLANLIRRRIPFVLVNSVTEHASTNMVNPDYARGAYELAEHLIGLGHRQIRLVVCPEESSALLRSMAGYETSLRRYGLAAREAVRLSGTETGMDRAALVDAFGGSEAATAAIGVGVHAIDALLRHRGAEVRSGTSVVGVLEPAQPVDRAQPLTTYEVDMSRLVRWAMRILIDAAPAQAPQQVIVPGTLIDRGSASAVNTGPVAPPSDAVL